MSELVRLGYLGNYLRELIDDVTAQGKVVKIDGNPIQVAAVAVLSGTIAVAETMLADIKVLAGSAKDQAKLRGRPALESMVGGIVGGVTARGTGLILDKLFGGGKR